MKIFFITLMITFSQFALSFTYNIYNQDVVSITSHQSVHGAVPKPITYVYLSGKTMFEKNISFYLQFDDMNNEHLNLLRLAFINEKKVNLNLFFPQSSGVDSSEFRLSLERHYRPSDSSAAVFTFAPKIKSEHIVFVKALRNNSQISLKINE